MPARFPIAVHIFLLRGDEVLLLRRYNTGYEDGRLSVVAGHVEPGESVTRSALRETREEVGLELMPGRLRMAGVMHRRSGHERVDVFPRSGVERIDVFSRSGDERVDFFLTYHTEGEEPRNLEPEKCSELVWARVDGLPDDVIPYVRAAIENFRAGTWFQEFGWTEPLAGGSNAF
jgi:8-oxo-dGTP diphosphatase